MATLENLYPEKDREIFAVRTPQGMRHYDPSAISRRLDFAEQQGSRSYDAIQDSLANCLNAIKESAASDGGLDPGVRVELARCLEDLATLGYVAFEAKPIDAGTGEGWTEEEATAALNAFIQWEHDLRGKRDRSPHSSPDTDGPPASSESLTLNTGA